MVRETGGSSPASRMCLASPPVPRRLCSAWRHPAVFVREEQLRLARLEKHGPKGEPLSQDQVLLLDLEPGVQAEEVAKEAPCQESQEILDLIAKLYAVESERLALVLKIIQTGTVWLPSDNFPSINAVPISSSKSSAPVTNAAPSSSPPTDGTWIMKRGDSMGRGSAPPPRAEPGPWSRGWRHLGSCRF